MDRGKSRPGTTVAIAIVAWLSCASPSLATPLSELSAELREPLPARIEAGGVELLALEPGARARLDDWLLRGGRLALRDDAAGAALRSLIRQGSCAGDDRRWVGLGSIETLAPAMSPRALPDPTPAVARHARALAAASKPGAPGPAPRLALYGLLVLAVFAGTARAALPARGVAVLSLVAVFASWPLWVGTTPWGAPAVAQADLVVDGGCGASVGWSAATVLTKTRGIVALDPGDGSREVRLDGTPVSPAGVRGASTLRIPAARDRRLELTWLWSAAAGSGDLPVAELALHGDAVRGVVRAGAARGWTELRLILPGREPLVLDDVEAGAALVVDGSPPPCERCDAVVDRLAAGLDHARARLLRSAGPVVMRLLERDAPVLVAWSDAPVRAVTGPAGDAPVPGGTLWIGSARSSS